MASTTRGVGSGRRMIVHIDRKLDHGLAPRCRRFREMAILDARNRDSQVSSCGCKNKGVAKNGDPCDKSGLSRFEGNTMPYDKTQATHEFTRWSENYDRCILQRLLFGPSHRAIIEGLLRTMGSTADSNPRCRMWDRRFRRNPPGIAPECASLGCGSRPRNVTQGRGTMAPACPFVTPIQGDSERLPFASSSFDVVTCANSFHHYPHQARAISEMHRVLSAAGRLMLIDGYRDGPWGWFIYDVCVAGVEGDVHHASARRVRELTSRAGFGQVVQKVHHGAAPFLFTEAAVSGHATGATLHRRCASFFGAKRTVAK